MMIVSLVMVVINMVMVIMLTDDCVLYCVGGHTHSGGGDNTQL